MGKNILASAQHTPAQVLPECNLGGALPGEAQDRV